MNKNEVMKKYSRDLRKNMTPEERHLWYDFLRKLPVKVLRQKVLGEYIVDFYIASAKLVIELDGEQHHTGAQLESDRSRDLYFSKYQITVLRYSNKLINSYFYDVCNDILKHLDLTFEELK